jgi:prevent-host-death family protein
MNLAISKAKSKLTDLVKRAELGEEVVLTRHGNEVVKLVPIKPALDEDTKKEIISRLIQESQRIISRETNAADSQDFLYGEDGMPS